MNFKYFFFVNIFTLFTVFSQNKAIEIENADYKVLINQSEIDSTGSSERSFLITYDAVNIEIEKLFKYLISSDDIINIENLPKNKYLVKIILFNENPEVKLKLLKELCARFNLILNIRDRIGLKYQLNVLNMDLLIEKCPPELEGLESFVVEDSLQAFVTINQLAKTLYINTKNVYTFTDRNGYLKDKYYFEIDLKNIDESLSKMGMSRTGSPKKTRIFNFTLEKVN